MTTPRNVPGRADAHRRALELVELPTSPGPLPLAACLGAGAAMFPVDSFAVPAARAICATCPDRRAAACLTDALAEETSAYAALRFGIRAGLTGTERHNLALALAGTQPATSVA